jgi:Rps23 Pro-64 3,4-dihydroxylase Tpa1-like proline 4-hydroxylase
MIKKNQFRKHRVIQTPTEGWTALAYDYHFTFDDKIYASALNNPKIVQDFLHLEGEQSNEYLVAEIAEEVYPQLSEENVDDLKKELIPHLENILGAPIEDININGETDLGIENDVWINYQRKGEFNPIHNHRGVFSFVIYADVPEEIRKEHETSLSQVNGLIQFSSNKSDNVLTVNPRNNDILIFESSHKHQVWPFSSDKTRITIAGNILDVKLKDG